MIAAKSVAHQEDKLIIISRASEAWPGTVGRLVHLF